MGYHAKRSPSSAKQWTDCTASIDAQAGFSDSGSEAARLGTCQHQLSAECLEHGHDPQSYLGRKMLFWVSVDADGDDTNGEDWESAFFDDMGFGPEIVGDPLARFVNEVVVTQDMIAACTSYINFVNQVADSTGAEMYVEQRVPIGHITGEARDGSKLEDAPEGAEEAAGTADVILVADDTLTTIDAKFGRAKVNAYEVITPAREDAITGEMEPEVLRMNLQLALYLLGSLRKYGHVGIKYVKAIIVQPYLTHVSEYSCTVEELLALGEWIKERASAGRTNPVFSPSFSNCHYCRAKFTCKAREGVVLATALDGFDDVDHATPKVIKFNELGSLYASVDMIMDWCKDVQMRTFEELSAGHEVRRNDGLRYKLVTGKKGDREWADKVEAEAAMKRMRLKESQMYTFKLAGPATLEKLATVKRPNKGQPAEKPVLGPTQWARLTELIVQRDGSPTVALETDPRDEIGSAVAGFDDVAPEAAQSCDDLF